ncbi:hypothetical protein Zmor_020964 [Zophobas morio]|uniref:F-box domain-containing protein n=1 Tax=Zophobas morio TaxID=2755281 RepID=A0AA38I4I0_9CUCU|nr:hypothetical protein Zmor_020964 [Zophobas morio]
MYQILPFVTASEFALPDLPVELWANILRCLDPSSLLTATRSSDPWKRIAQGDPVLRKTVKNQLVLEKRKRREEMLNPGLLLSITREGSGRLFGSNTGKVLRTQFSVKGPVKTQEKRKRRQNKDAGPLRKKIIHGNEYYDCHQRFGVEEDRQFLLVREKRRRRDEMLNPGLLLSITREGSGRPFGSNASKVLRT